MKKVNINELLEVENNYQAPERIMSLLLNKDTSDRDCIFLSFLFAFKYDVSYDWFHEYFLDEHADRRNMKQDFTPNNISKLVSEIMRAGKGITYEPSAGTGGMVITEWDNNRLKSDAFEYNSSEHMVICHDLSDRSIPFLLFNLSIRGIMGLVIHGNTLTKDIQNIYVLTNKKNSHTSFSDVSCVADISKVEIFNSFKS